jgi:hypothetical protein
MRSKRRKVVRGTVGPVGLAVASACVLAGLAISILAHTELHSLRLSELRKPQGDALACADTSTAPTDEPVAWCADPSSPQCLPALPPHAAPDLHDVQPATFAALLQLPRARKLLPITPWRRPREERAPRSREPDRLERPPRA